uniref:Centrobin, centrosomal BRCA2 interacting protein n=1 Tax=Mus musculus TaxID=10090 RepID=D6RGB4_MOUSE
MATAAPSPSSPLRPEDLLSDSSEPPGLNQVSSEVTSQLYTSLHLSRQAEATARAQLYLAPTSSPPNEGLDSLAQELSRSLSVGLENNLKKKELVQRDGKRTPLTVIAQLPCSTPGLCKTCLHPALPRHWKSCFPATLAFGPAPPPTPQIFRG